AGGEGTRTATAADDCLLRTPKDDGTVLKAGADEAGGLEGNDVIRGGQGDDTFLTGDDGSDVVKGQQDDDEVCGNGQNDRLFGGQGDDNIGGSNATNCYMGWFNDAHPGHAGV